MSAGTLITGGVLSSAAFSVTVTLKVAVDLLPALSSAVHVTVVSPSGKVEPDSGLHLTGTEPSTSSLAVGGLLGTIPPAGVPALVVVVGGAPPGLGGPVSLVGSLQRAVGAVFLGASA